MSWQNLSYTKKGVVVGVMGTFLGIVVGMLFFGVKWSYFNLDMLTFMVLASLPILLGLGGSIMDSKKNKKILPVGSLGLEINQLIIAIFSVLLFVVVAAWLLAFVFLGHF